MLPGTGCPIHKIPAQGVFYEKCHSSPHLGMQHRQRGPQLKEKTEKRREVPMHFPAAAFLRLTPVRHISGPAAGWEAAAVGCALRSRTDRQNAVRSLR